MKLKGDFQHNRRICFIKICRDNDRMFSSSWDGKIIEWSINQRNSIRSYGKLFGTGAGLTITPDEKYLFAGGCYVGELIQIDIINNKLAKKYDSIMIKSTWAMEVTSDSKILIVGIGCQSGCFYLFDIKKQLIAKKLNHITGLGDIESIAISPNDRHVHITGTGGIWMKYDLRTGLVLKR